MKKRALKSSSALATLLVLGVSVATSVEAATVVGGDYKSSANLTLKAGTGPIDPYDPNDPGTGPVDPTDPGTPGTPGNLTVDYGSSFNFGTQTISTSGATYYAHPDVVTKSGTNQAVPAFSQVTDQSGDLAGWTLTLTQESDLHLSSGTSSDPGYALTGAEISFTGGKIVAAGGNTATAPSDVVAADKLVPGQAVKLVSASAGQGAGSWQYQFSDVSAYDSTSVDLNNPSDKSKVASKSPVQLSIPVGLTQKAAAYTTNLSWSLQAVPGNTQPSNP